ncbi:MAG: polyprenyl diphosphate synthase, partial [Bacilli bacterium]
VYASKKIAKDVKSGKIDIESIDKITFNKYLFNDLPPIDFLIRTSGEYRISNFMLWQVAYAEMYFTETLWPDFSKNEFDKALLTFSSRNRRFGGTEKK